MFPYQRSRHNGQWRYRIGGFFLFAQCCQHTLGWLKNFNLHPTIHNNERSTKSTIRHTRQDESVGGCMVKNWHFSSKWKWWRRKEKKIFPSVHHSLLLVWRDTHTHMNSKYKKGRTGYAKIGIRPTLNAKPRAQRVHIKEIKWLLQC